MSTRYEGSSEEYYYCELCHTVFNGFWLGTNTNTPRTLSILQVVHSNYADVNMFHTHDTQERTTTPLVSCRSLTIYVQNCLNTVSTRTTPTTYYHIIKPLIYSEYLFRRRIIRGFMTPWLKCTLIKCFSLEDRSSRLPLEVRPILSKLGEFGPDVL